MNFQDGIKKLEKTLKISSVLEISLSDDPGCWIDGNERIPRLFGSGFGNKQKVD